MEPKNIIYEICAGNDVGMFEASDSVSAAFLQKRSPQFKGR